MKPFSSYAPPILEAWATWEVLRKLGFKADDIFWEFRNTLNAIPKPGLTLSVFLRAQEKELSITCSHRLTEGQARRMEQDAKVFMADLSAGKFNPTPEAEAEMTRSLHASYAWTNQAALLMVLGAKGFALPFQLARAGN